MSHALSHSAAEAVDDSKRPVVGTPVDVYVELREAAVYVGVILVPPIAIITSKPMRPLGSQLKKNITVVVR